MEINEYISKFNGDRNLAFQHLAEEVVLKKYDKAVNYETANVMIKGLTGKDAEDYMSAVFATLKKYPKINYEIKKEFQRSLFATNVLQMNVDEIKNAEKNPYKAKIFKGILKLIVTGALFVAAGVLIPGVGTIASLPAVKAAVSVLFATILSTTSFDIVKYFVFRNFKNQIENYPSEIDNAREEAKKL